MMPRQICQLCLNELEGDVAATFTARPIVTGDEPDCFVCRLPASVSIDLDEHADRIARLFRRSTHTVG